MLYLLYFELKHEKNVIFCNKNLKILHYSYIFVAEMLKFERLDLSHFIIFCIRIIALMYQFSDIV